MILMLTAGSPHINPRSHSLMTSQIVILAWLVKNLRLSPLYYVCRESLLLRLPLILTIWAKVINILYSTVHSSSLI